MEDEITKKRHERLRKYDNIVGPTERIQIFDEFCEHYDNDVSDVGYNGPITCAELAAKYTCNDRGNKVVLDIGSGTGLVGEELVKYGFKIIDGLDPSAGMNEVARKKKVYRNFYTEFLTAEPSKCIPEDSYDVITVVGAYQHGQMPYDGILEMIRLAKTGGIICIVSRKEAFYEYEEYKDKFIPLCSQLETENKWKKEEFDNFEDYHPNLDGTKIVYRVL